MANLTRKRQKSNYPIKDPLDRVTSMTSPTGTTYYHYDTLTGRLDRITSPEGKEFTYSYNHGQLENLIYPNGISAHYAFDDNGNLTDLDYRKNGTSVRRYQYGYDKNGMRMNMTDNDGMHDYAYDTLYQIIRATHPSIPNPLEQFSYDVVGNRLTDMTHTNYQYNELNQLTEDDSCKYAYDADGNMTEKIDKATGDTTHFVYDIENKMVEVRKPGMLSKYSYDALGRRMSKEVNGEVRQFRYDGQSLIFEMNGNDSVIANYTFGPAIDDPLSMNKNGNNYYYVKDGLNSVAALTDSIGNVKHEYKYEVFGKIVEESGDTIENPFTYTSREREKENSVYYYRARTYDPILGRFSQEDPIRFSGSDVNFYRYVFNNPLNAFDPLGLKCWLLYKSSEKVSRYSPNMPRDSWIEERSMSITINVVYGDEDGELMTIRKSGYYRVRWSLFRITGHFFCIDKECKGCPTKCSLKPYTKEEKLGLTDKKTYEYLGSKWEPWTSEE
jgi:RHS repeat-associated protein